MRFPKFGVMAAAGLWSAGAHAQFMDMEAMANLQSVAFVHYVAEGVVSQKHVGIPAAEDVDQYADVQERITLSFDWDVNANQIVGTPTITNHPSVLGPLSGLDDGCPGGELKGPYEHFDAVELKADGTGIIEIVGRRKHPDTLVAESCGSGRTPYKGGERSVSTIIAPPQLMMLAFGAMLGADSSIQITPDGKSIIMASPNAGWTWTFTPTAK